jgi:hypothetical protein
MSALKKADTKAHRAQSYSGKTFVFFVTLWFFRLINAYIIANFYSLRAIRNLFHSSRFQARPGSSFKRKNAWSIGICA